MIPTFLRSYAGQIKIFLVLLVLFLAVAIYFDFHLLVLARNAIQEEAGLRLGVEADLLRTELERDGMLRPASPDDATPFVPPAHLERLVRVHDLRRVDLLSPRGLVLSSSDPSRIGRSDPFLLGDGGRERRRVVAGATAVTPLHRAGRTPFATLAAYRPIRDREFVTRAILRLEREVPALASVDLDLRSIAALQAGGLAFVLLLVVLFARWLLRPYRRLQQAAGLAAVPEPSADMDDAEALVAAVQGVLEKMRAQEGELQALKGSAERSPGSGAGFPGERLLSGMTSAALVFDRDARLVTLNAAAERLLGVGPSPPGRPADEILAPHAPLLDLVRGGLGRGEARSREVVTLRGPDGRTAHVGVMLSPIRGSGAAPGGPPVDGVVCLLTDLTEIRALRERARVRDNLAVLGEMSAGIAHEFRNALAVIQGHARLQARALAQTPARGHAEAIEREVARLLRVVGDFLRFARPVTPDLAETDLARLVREAADDLRADPANVLVTVSIEGVFPPIRADETLLKQALHNLLRNACEAVREAGPPAAARTIVVRGREEEAGERGRVRIEVEDDGPGIPPEDRPHIFTPFYTTKNEGTGLGLPLVQKVAALHDGSIEALPREGGGTVMVLTLPLRPAPPVPIDLVA